MLSPFFTRIQRIPVHPSEVLHLGYWSSGVLPEIWNPNRHTQHGIGKTGSIVVYPATLTPHVYKLSFVQKVGYTWVRVPCLVNGCLYQAKISSLLRQHFFNQHPTFKLQHLKAWLKRMAPSLDFFSLAEYQYHYIHCGWATKTCSCLTPTFEKWTVGSKQAAAAAQAWVFTIDDIKLKTVENFNYLEWQILSWDSDFPALFLNLSKAQKRLV